MKVSVTRTTQMQYYDHRTIEVEVPDGLEGDELTDFISNWVEENDEDFYEADTNDEWSDPEDEWFSYQKDNETIYVE